MLRVFCARSMHVAVRTLAAETGDAADIVFEPMGALQARLAAGWVDEADLVAAAAPAEEAAVPAEQA